MESARGKVRGAIGGVGGVEVACFHLVTILAGSNRTARGVLEQVSLSEARVQTAMRARPGEVLVLTAVFDTSVVRIACKVVETRNDGLSLRIIAITPEAQAALTRFIFSRLKADPRNPAYLTPRFKDQPGQSRRVYRAFAPELRDTNRHQAPSERWLDRGRG